MDKSKFLASDKPVAREVTFTDGTVDTLHFKQVTAGDMRRWRMAEASGDEDRIVFGMQRLVAASLCDEKGKLALSEREAYGLTLQGLNDLFPHVMAVAGMDEGAKKASPSAEETGSAAS